MSIAELQNNVVRSVRLPLLSRQAWFVRMLLNDPLMSRRYWQSRDIATYHGKTCMTHPGQFHGARGNLRASDNSGRLATTNTRWNSAAYSIVLHRHTHPEFCYAG